MRSSEEGPFDDRRQFPPGGITVRALARHILPGSPVAARPGWRPPLPLRGANRGREMTKSCYVLRELGWSAAFQAQLDIDEITREVARRKRGE
jgi:hypothetical protein